MQINKTNMFAIIAFLIFLIWGSIILFSNSTANYIIQESNSQTKEHE